MCLFCLLFKSYCEQCCIHVFPFLLFLLPAHLESKVNVHVIDLIFVFSSLDFGREAYWVFVCVCGSVLFNFQHFNFFYINCYITRFQHLFLKATVLYQTDSFKQIFMVILNSSTTLSQRERDREREIRMCLENIKQFMYFNFFNILMSKHQHLWHS